MICYCVGGSKAIAQVVAGEVRLPERRLGQEGQRRRDVLGDHPALALLNEEAGARLEIGGEGPRPAGVAFFPVGVPPATGGPAPAACHFGADASETRLGRVVLWHEHGSLTYSHQGGGGVGTACLIARGM